MSQRWSLVSGVYLALGMVAAGVSWYWRDCSPWSLPNPWLSLVESGARLWFSLLLGLAIGGLVVMSTRWLVQNVRVVAGLHDTLRPLSRDMSNTTILVLALSSSIGEELLFRGLFQPAIGLWPQAILFGLLHQIGGKGRWLWPIWAMAMGGLLGSMYALTGSLLGPIVSHAMINALNLLFLRSYDPLAARRSLGGLLGTRRTGPPQ